MPRRVELDKGRARDNVLERVGGGDDDAALDSRLSSQLDAAGRGVASVTLWQSYFGGRRGGSCAVERRMIGTATISHSGSGWRCVRFCVIGVVYKWFMFGGSSCLLGHRELFNVNL